MISGDTGRTPDEGQTAGSQSIENSGTALRMAGAEVRAILLDLAAKRLGVAGRSADGRRRRRSRRRTGARSATASSPPPSISIARRRAKVAPKPPASSQDRRQVDSARRHSGARSPAARPTCRTCGCPAWCTGAWCVRRATARSSTASTRPRSRRCRAWSRWCATARFLGVVAEREEQAIKAREALPRARNGQRGRSCPIPRDLFDVIKSLPSKDATIGVKQARRAGERRARSRRSTPSPTWRMPRSGRPARWPNSRTAR